MSEGYAEFEFDLPEALLAALTRVLDSLASAPLDEGTASTVPNAQGVYQLFHQGKLVYIGKTDAESGLRNRLRRHAVKLLHRPSLQPGSVHYKAVRIMVFTAMDLESSLIRHYGKLSSTGRIPWNNSGFGSNDPGRERETTNKAPEGFDAQFPISTEIPGNYVAPGTKTVAQALAVLKASLPYTLRYETLRGSTGRAQRGQPHPDLVAAAVEIPDTPFTVHQFLRIMMRALPAGWQATQFVSHVILYKESRGYAHGAIIN